MRRAAGLAIAFGVLMFRTTANDPPEPAPPPPPVFRTLDRFELKVDLTAREVDDALYLDGGGIIDDLE